MKKVLKAILLVFVFVSSSFANQHIESELEFDSLTSEGNVIVDFYATWCPPCQELGYSIAKLDEESLGVKIYKINVDEHPELQLLYTQSQAIPAMLFIKDGKVVKKSFGAKSPRELKGDIARYF